MSDFIAEYGELLHDAARRRSVGGSAAGNRRKLATVGAATALLVAAPALAATGFWRPLLGDAVHQAPTATLNSAPADQRAVLGVLRRPQTDQDRGPTTTAALQSLTATVAGVRTQDIRLLRANAGGHAIVLVPVERFGLEPAEAPKPPSPAPAGDDGLCLVPTDTEHGQTTGAGFGCYRIGQVQSGTAIAAVGQQVYGLVPDDVDSISVRLSDGHSIDTSVRDNLFTYALPVSAQTRATSLEWRDASDTVIKSLDGTAVPSPHPTDPATSLCDPAVPPAKCMSGTYAP